MCTSVRILSAASAVLMLAYCGWADEAGENVAEIYVIVPEDAEVSFDDAPTRQTGLHRKFYSPALTPGKTYSYTVKVCWSENGKPVEQTRTVDVSANSISHVEFIKPKQQPIAPHWGNLNAAAFSPDGKLLATAGSEHRIILWDPATLRRLGEFQGLGPLAFSPDGKLLAGRGSDESVRIWDVNSRKGLRRFSAPPPSRLAFAPRGRELAILYRDRLTLWDTKTGRKVITSDEVPPDSATLVFSPDGHSLAVGGGQPHKDTTDDPPPDWKTRRNTMEPSIAVLDAANGRLRRRIQGELYTHQLCYTPDGKTLIASGYQPITLWDPHTGRQIGKFGDHRGGGGVVLTNDGRTLVSEEAGNRAGDWVCVRRLDGKLVRRWHVRVTNSMLILALSPDNRTLLTGGHQDPGFRLWDITTGNELFVTQRPPAKRP